MYALLYGGRNSMIIYEAICLTDIYVDRYLSHDLDKVLSYIKEFDEPFFIMEYELKDYWIQGPGFDDVGSPEGTDPDPDSLYVFPEDIPSVSWSTSSDGTITNISSSVDITYTGNNPTNVTELWINGYKII